MKFRALNRFFSTVLTSLMMVVLSLAWTVPVFADDSTPPVETPASVEVTPALPEGTQVVVTDESGANLPLVTQAASDALVSGDPMWCPAGVAPKAGVGGCSPSFDRFGYDTDNGGDGDSNDADGSLVDWLTSNQPTKAGTIWVEYNYNTGSETATSIILSGSNLVSMSNFALTIQGGWNGVAGSKLLNTTDPYSYLNKSLEISNWTGTVTLNNLVFDGVVTNSPGSNFALAVITKGNITLNDVSVQNSDNLDDTEPMYLTHGASLDNTSGTGTVTVKNSDFANNEGAGLYIFSRGAVTTINLIANSNDGEAGVFIDNSTVQGKTVTLKGLQQFNNNGGDGLKVLSAGLITIGNISANDNGDSGVRLENTSGTANPGITLSGTNYALNNGEYGFYVYSFGAIKTNNLNASGNDGMGAYLGNCYLSGCDLKNPIALTGVNTFNDNGTTVNHHGLFVYSRGVVTLSNVTASYNSGEGVFIFNALGDPYGVHSNNPVTLTGYGIFEHNTIGLDVISSGKITLANLSANFNGTGAVIQNFGLVATTTISGFNVFENNTDTGLFVNSYGTITLSNLTSSHNGAYGAELIGSSIDKPYNIALKGSNTFEDNGFGLRAVTMGSITVNNLRANSNGVGVFLDNCFVMLGACQTLLPKPIILTGYVTANGNDQGGLAISASGAFTASNVTANDNTSQNGVDITSYQTVTLLGKNVFNENGQSGLIINAYGAVTLNNITANDNGTGRGVYISNAKDVAKAQSVTLKGVNQFNGNGSDGLYILSYGTVMTTELTAMGNIAGSGAYIDNTGGLYAKNITLAGTNNFSANGSHGVEFSSTGAVNLNRVIADGNVLRGIQGTQAGSVTLTCAYTVNNQVMGYNINATGPVIMNGIFDKWNVTPSSVFGLTVTIKKPCLLP